MIEKKFCIRNNKVISPQLGGKLDKNETAITQQVVEQIEGKIIIQQLVEQL